MADSKIIAVVGATGAQGGGLVRAILADQRGGYRARALTRHPDSVKAQALAAAGAEVVAADLDDPASLESAFAGAYGAFCRDQLLGALLARSGSSPRPSAMAQAAKAAGVRSTRSGPRWKTRGSGCRSTTTACPRSWASTRCRTSTPRAKPITSFATTACRPHFLLTAFYWDNLIYFGAGPQRGPDGVLGDHLSDGRQEASRHRG